MKRSLLIFILLFCIFPQGWSQKVPGVVPKIVIGIVVENMRPDYIDRYRNHFGNDGFRKLFSSGACFTDVRMDQYILDNASVTASLFTGVPPSVHGIIDNLWYDREKGIIKNCVADDKFSIVGSDSGTGSTSPSELMAFTVAEQLKLSTQGKAKVYSIAMNEAPAVFSCGFAGDAAYWFDETSGRMVTSSFYLKQLPEWVIRFNQQNFSRKYASGKWVLLKSGHEYTASISDNDTLETGYGPGMNTFPHDIRELVSKAGNYSPLKTTPGANSLVRSFLIDLLEHEPVGTDQFPDLITIFFSSMDKELDSFGPMSVEMEDLYLRMDEEIAGIISYAEKRYGPENLLIFLTSNGSASYPVNWLKQKFRIPASHFAQENAHALLNTYLNFTYGDLRWIEYFDGFQVYLNHRLINLNKVELKDIRKKTADFLTQFEGVQLAVTADQIEQKQLPDNQLNGIDKSYTPSRSGDVLYMLKEGWQPEVKGRNESNSDNRFIPLVFYGSGIMNKTIRTPYHATDIAPTLSAIMRIPRPDRCHGIVMEGF